MPETTTLEPTPDPFRKFYRAKDEDELATRIVGGHVMTMATIGICFNIFMFLHFLSKEKLSFFILCTSKTASNTMSLLIYLCYIGPVNLFYTAIGSMDFSAHLQQVFGGGLFIQGPMTQMLITVNRFLVIIFSPTTIPKYSTHITVAALVISWIMGVLWSTLPGLADYCFNPFFFTHVGYYESKCQQQVVVVVALLVLFLAVFNNTMNVILAIKLLISAKKQKSISSEVARNRRRQTIRFFVQSVVQDWMTAIVVGTNIFMVSIFCDKHTCSILTTFSVDSMYYSIDGIVMFLFNYKRDPKKKSIRVEHSNSAAFVSRASITATH